MTAKELQNGKVFISLIFVYKMARYGRCMSKQEAKDLKKTMKLQDCIGNLIPVFDSSKAVESRLKNMDVDRLKNYFRMIGVRNPSIVAFFDIPNSGMIVGPIPQKNGLREYKIPEGTRINGCDLIKL